MKGQLVHALRSALGDCTNGGITSKHDSFVLVGEGLEGTFEAREDLPALRVVVRWRGTAQEYIHAEPVDQPEGMAGPSFGGNYVSSSDSRVTKLCRYPIPVHDRFDTWEDHAILSR